VKAIREALEQAMAADPDVIPSTIAQAAYQMVRDASNWTPDPERARLSRQQQFRGPF